MFTVPLVSYDTREEDVVPAVMHSLRQLFAHTERVFAQTQDAIGACQRRVDGFNARFSRLNDKLERLAEMELPVVADCAELPRPAATTRPLVFHSDGVSAPTLRGAVGFSRTPESFLKKRRFNSIFPNGKPHEVLENREPERTLFSTEFANPTPSVVSDFRKSTYSFLKKPSDDPDDILHRSLIPTDTAHVEDDEFLFKKESAEPSDFDLPDVLPGIQVQRSIFGDDLSGDEEMFCNDPNESPFESPTSSKTQPSEPMEKSEITLEIVAEKPVDKSEQEPKEASMLQSASTTPASATPALATPASGAPPAPPPPPPPASLLASPQPGRAGLMEAIRQAGGRSGAGLKKVAPPASAPSAAASAAPSADDLMGSLAKALELRRKGISGKTARKLDALEGRTRPARGPRVLESMREVLTDKFGAGDSSDEPQDNEDWT